MIAFDDFAARTAELSQGAARLETIERRHRILVAGFARLERAAALEHELGRSAAGELTRLVRIGCRIAHCDAEALAIVNALLPLAVVDDGRG